MEPMAACSCPKAHIPSICPDCGMTVDICDDCFANGDCPACGGRGVEFPDPDAAQEE
jgi:hypothetical protein